MTEHIIQFKRGNTEQHKLYKGKNGEVTFNTDENTLVSHNGNGGQTTLVRNDLTNITGHDSENPPKIGDRFVLEWNGREYCIVPL